MHQFDQQVLRALARAEEKWMGSVWSSEVLKEGKAIFGADWGDPYCTSRSNIRYAPLVSLSLGRLKKMDFVEKVHPFTGKGTHQHQWELTEIGELFIQQWRASHASV